jgi:hypothetical protein
MNWILSPLSVEGEILHRVNTRVEFEHNESSFDYWSLR